MKQAILTELIHLDAPLATAELTDYGETLRDSPWIKERFEFDPYCVFVRHDGALYLYYEQAGMDWKIEQAGKFDKEIMMRQTLAMYAAVEDIITNEKALSREEFEQFVTTLKQAWTWWDCMWWMIECYDKHKLPLDDLLAVRKQTEYLAPGITATLRNSIRSIVPEDKKKFVDVLLINEVLSGELPSNVTLEQRLVTYAYTNGKLYNSVEEVHKDYNFIIQQPEVVHDTTTLQGQSAFAGKVQGRVKIIATRDDMADFQQGDVIVASTTTPDFLPAMKKAAAIISEHGGVICHAAITSRELKIPCVVGVKGATKILKNGDLVEVDAEKGVITKL